MDYVVAPTLIIGDHLKDIEFLSNAVESETIEFKESFGSEAIETAVAFANTRGGTIFIGVNNAGHSSGRKFRNEALRDFVNRIATATEPAVIPSAQIHHLTQGDVLAIQVSEMPLKPVATKGRCFKRSGSTNRVMSASEITEMHVISTGQSMDSLLVPRKTRDDLDLVAVKTYMRKASAQGRRNFAEGDDPWQVLQKLELVKSETEITRAAILLFGKAPQSPLTQAVVHAGRVRQLTHIMDHRVRFDHRPGR